MKCEKDLLSVIVPVYNVESYLRQCIESILMQTYQNLELLLVDDGSTDGSGIICDEYAKKDSRIRVIHKNNGGLVSARKAGIESATGVYATYVDGDDWIEPTLYEEVFCAMQEQQSDVVLYGMKEDYSNRTVEVLNAVSCGFYDRKEIQKKILNIMLNNNIFFEFGIIPNIWAKLAKTELVKSAQGEVNDLIDVGEDVVCTANLMLAANSVLVLPLTGYHYRKRNDSMMGKKTEFVKLKGLFQNLYETFMRQKNANGIMEQLWSYMLFVLLLKQSEIFFKKDMVKGPFSEVMGRKFALYGAGGFGQELYTKVLGTKVADVSVWVDRRFELYQEYGLPVKSVEVLREMNFDVLFIAVLNVRTCEAIKKELISFGIEENKIKYVTDSEENLEMVKTLLLKT